MDSSTDNDYKLLSEPNDALKCLICLKTAKEPKQHEDCGKLFCENCIELNEKNGNRSCPHCRKDNPKYFKDSKSKEIIEELAS